MGSPSTVARAETPEKCFQGIKRTTGRLETDLRGKKVEQLNLQLSETRRWDVRTMSLGRFKEGQMTGSMVAARKTEQKELRRSHDTKGKTRPPLSWAWNQQPSGGRLHVKSCELQKP